MLAKCCPKCRGDLGLEPDVRGGGTDLVCLQCGYRARPQEVRSLLARLAGVRHRPPAPALARVPHRPLR